MLNVHLFFLEDCLCLLKLALADNENAINAVAFLEQVLVSLNWHPVPAPMKSNQHLGATVSKLPHFPQLGNFLLLKTFCKSFEQGVQWPSLQSQKVARRLTYHGKA